MSSLIDKLVDPVLERYGVPDWVKPYVLKYVKRNPANTVKFAASFIDVKRKKGEITGEYIKLPNGLKFRKDHILHLLNIVFYGEESMARIAEAWAGKNLDNNRDYASYFREMGAKDAKHARAIKNLMEGMGRKPEKPQKEIEEVFNYIASLDSWYDRILATELILRNSYAKTFGLIFYKVFYPVSPEFMRSFGKAFTAADLESAWGISEARRVIETQLISDEHIIELTREVLIRIQRSIDANMRLAKASGIEDEAKLLSDIAIAYPLQALSMMGIKVNVGKEMNRIKKAAAKLKY